jgi:serine protease Do
MAASLNRIVTAVLILSISQTTPAVCHAQSDAEEQAFRQAAAIADPSIVRIETVGGLDLVGDLLTGSGPTTGVIVAPDGLIITSSFNFISKPASILVTLGDGRRFAANQIASDRARMLTLLKIEASALVPLTAAPKDEFRVGQWAIALGRTYDSPFPGVSVGIISALDRIWGRAVQTDAKVSPVNYGGPLVDIHGRGIGILVPLSPNEQGETAGVEWYDSGIGFAVPLSDVYAVLDRLRTGDDLKPGLLGVTFKEAGVLAGAPVIDRVRPTSPADKAGIVSGDLITAVDGTPVDRIPALQHQLGPHYAGDTVALSLRREDKPHDVRVQLVGELLPYAAGYLGILPERPMADAQPAAIAIRAVLDGSPAAQASLQPRDVITAIGPETLAGADMLRDRIGRIAPGESVEVTFTRSGKPQSATITLAGVPDTLPVDLKPAVHPAARPPAADAPQTDRYTATLPGGEQEFWAYVPDGYLPNVPYGLLVWLHPAGDTMEAAMLRAWQALCNERGIILLAPKAADINSWTADEAEFVRGVVEHVQATYTIDPSRVAVLGDGVGGAFAWHVGFKHRELFRGIAVVGAPLRMPPPDNDPKLPQQLVVIGGAEDQLRPQLDTTIEVLRKLKFPTATLTPTGAGAPPQSIAPQLALWLDALDRI